MTQTNDDSGFRNETTILEAEFRTKDIISYQMMSTSIGLACTVVGIVLIPIALILIKIIAPHVVKTWECTLTNRAVHVKKGLFIKVKKTIPLEKITDVGSVQGPIMRKFDLHALSFETAGQSSGTTGGALVKLIGIKDSEAFRDVVLNTRDMAAEATGTIAAGVTSKVEGETEVLRDIRDSLLRIEDRLNQQD